MCRLDQISVRTHLGVQQLGGKFGDLEIDAETIMAVEGEGKVQVPYEGVIGTLDFFDVVDLGRKNTPRESAEAAEKEPTASRSGSPTPTSPNAPSPKPSKRLVPTMSQGC